MTLSRPWREAVALAYRLLPWLPTREVSVSVPTGGSLLVTLPEIVGMDLYRHGHIEPELTSVLLGTLSPGMVFADVGGHYGYYAALAAPLVGPGGRVFVFEPGRRTLRLLERNVAGLSNVQVEPLAVCDRAGRRTLHDFGSRHSALSSLFPEARTPAPERARLSAQRYEVDSVSLDEYFARLGVRPDVIKIDAESSELDVLRGMEGILRAGSPLVTIEVGDYETASQGLSRRCVDFMGAMGYACLEYAAGRLVPHRPRDRYAYGNLYFRR
jgi:FkbM family methyltransferase